MAFDSDIVCPRLSKMWGKIGATFEKQAIEAAETGANHRAVELGKFAEVCFWQATGESDSFSFKDLT